MIDIGIKIRSLRKAKGLSQVDLSNRLFVSKSILSAYEVGSRLPSLDMIKKLTKEFGISSDYLLGIEKAKTLTVDKLTDEQLEVVSSIINEFEKCNQQIKK